MKSYCEVKRCKLPADYIYQGHGVCQHHWESHCNDSKRFDLKREFKISEGDHGRLFD